MQQLTLSFEPGLTRKYRNVTECIATGVYRQGLPRVANRLDVAVSNLTVMLSDNPDRKAKRKRKFGVDDLENYLESGDLEPLYYLVEKYIPDAERMTKARALNQLNALMQEARSVIADLKE